MNTFTWLVMGHLVGDWLLQNDWMAKGKKTAFFAVAGVVHFTLYTLAILVALSLSGLKDQSLGTYVAAAIVTFLSHWIIDATDIVGAWIRGLHQSDNGLMHLMVDQSFHLVVLAILAAWLQP